MIFFRTLKFELMYCNEFLNEHPWTYDFLPLTSFLNIIRNLSYLSCSNFYSWTKVLISNSNFCIYHSWFMILIFKHQHQLSEFHPSCPCNCLHHSALFLNVPFLELGAWGLHAELFKKCNINHQKITTPGGVLAEKSAWYKMAFCTTTQDYFCIVNIEIYIKYNINIFMHGVSGWNMAVVRNGTLYHFCFW